MNSRRIDRLRGTLKKELSDIIRNRVKDPRVRFVTVTDVEISKDLRHVKVYVSVLGSDEDRTACLEGLTRALGFIRGEMGRRIRLRYTPEMVLQYDKSIDAGMEIDRLLKEAFEE